MAAPLPSGPERPLLWAVVILLSLGNLVVAAPYLPDGLQQSKQPSPLDFISPLKGGMIGPLFRPNDHTSVDLKAVGCYYQFNHYEEGDRIVTNEPCLNCTCHNSMLMCYLKVCPFSKPIGLDCTIEKSPEQCCPVITCPQVPVNLQVMHMTTSTTTASPAMQMTGIVPYVEHGCTMEGDYYPDGAQMPGNSSKPCELCYCIRNHTACIMQECILKVEGCIPVFQEGICCPVRYKCAHEDDDYLLTTTQPAAEINETTGLPVTTMIPGSGAAVCVYQDEIYADGASISTDDPCQHCYCMNGDLVCAVHECKSSLDEAEEGCVPRPPLPGQCCPQGYDCPDQIETSTILPDFATDFASTIPDASTDVPDSEKQESSEPSTAAPTISETYPHEYGTISTDEDSVLTRITPSETSQTDPADEEATPDAVTTDVEQPSSSTPQPTVEQEEELKDTTAVEESETVTKSPELLATADAKTTDGPSPVDVTSTSVDGLSPVDVESTSADGPSPVDVTSTSADGLSPADATSSSTPPSEELGVTDSSVSITVEETATTVHTPEDPVTEKDSLSSSQPATDDEEDALGESESTTEPETGDRVTTEVPLGTTTVSKDAIESETSTPSSENPVDISPAETESPLEPVEEKEPVEDSSGTSSVPEVTTPGIPGEGDCMMNGITFSNGDTVPTSSVCEESCTCRDSVVVCRFKSCAAPPPSFLRCTSAEISGECCPRYDCPEPQANNTCEKDGSVYEDGAMVPSENPCNECFCTEGKIICAVRECVPPPKGCVATPRLEDTCCPTEYECPSATPDVGDLVMMTEKPSTVKTYGNSCTEDGQVYEDGSPIPSKNICHLTCACKNGEVRCVQRACPPPPPAYLRCVTVEDATRCCPSYECPPPAMGPESTCRFNGRDYTDSELVPSFDKCEECRCIEGEVICAELECIPPGPNCIPTEKSEEMCCPTSYDCSNTTEIETPTSPVFSTVTDDDEFTGSPILPDIGKISPEDSTDTLTTKATDSEVTSEDFTASKATTIGPIETTSPAETSKPEISPEDPTETVTAKSPESGVTTSIDFTTSEAKETFTSPGTMDTTRTSPDSSDPDTVSEDTTDKSTTKTLDDEVSTYDESVSRVTMTTPKLIETTTFSYKVSELEVTSEETATGITAKIPETEVTASGGSTAPEDSEAATTPGPIETTSASVESSEPEMQADSTAQEDPKHTYGPATGPSTVIEDIEDKTTPPLIKDQPSTETPLGETTKTDVKPAETDDPTDATLTTEIDLRTTDPTKPEESLDGGLTTVVDSEAVESTKAPLTTVSGEKESTTHVYSSETVTETSFPSEGEKEGEFTGTDESSTAESISPEKESSLEGALTTETPVKLDISTESPFSSPADVTSSEKDAISETTESILTSIDESTSFDVSSKSSEGTESTPSLDKEDDKDEATSISDEQTTPATPTDRITTPLSDSDTTVDLKLTPGKESTEIPPATDDIQADTVTTSDITTPSSISTDVKSTTLIPEISTEKQETETSADVTTEKITPDDIRFTDALPDIGDSTLYKVPSKETSAPDVDSTEFSTTTEVVSTSKPAAVTSPDAVTSTIDEEHEKTISDEITESPDKISPDIPTETSFDDTSVTPSVPSTKTGPPEETELSTSTSVSDGSIETTTKVSSVEYTETESSTLSPTSESVTIASGEGEAEATESASETTESASETSVPDLFVDTCIVDGVTYFQGEVILSLSFQKCQGKCICNKSVVECSKPACPPPPPQHLKCEAVVKPQQCCPSYTCDDLSPGGDPTLTCEQYGETYKNGQYVPTSFECSDCYCIDSEVICEKIKCQQPIGNCTPLEISPGKCCPTEYKCTEAEPPQAKMTTPAPTEDELLQPTTPSLDEASQSCTKDGVTYMNGQTMPVSNSCQESCKCTDGSVKCKLQACPPSPPDFLKCVPQEKPDQCCPSYDCPSGIVNATEETNCEKDGLQYQSGELVPSSDHCSDCYCLDGVVTCAPLQCQAPGPNCIPNPIPEGSCCPTDYDCSDVSPAFGIETDYTPDLTFASVDETTEDTAREGETAVTTEDYEIKVTDSLPSDATTEFSEQESSTSSPGSLAVSPSVSEPEETESVSTPPTDTSDEPDAMVTDVATEESISTTPALEEGSCVKDQVAYTNGTEVASSNPCEETCVCLDGVVRCELQACPPAPPAFLRCTPIDQSDQCCPSYDCPEIQPDPTATTNCKVNETEYTDGEYVPSSSYCTDCYCSEGEVVCATIDCEAPGENCLPIEIPEGSCCPTRYSCADTPLTVPTDDYTYSVDSISTRITEDDRTESEVTVPESDLKSTGEDFTTVPSVEDKTFTDDATSATIGDVTEITGEPDSSSVTTSKPTSTKESESTSSKEFIPSTTPPTSEESKTTISATDVDSETERPSTSPKESEISDVTDTTTKSYTDETTTEIISMTDTSISSETQPDSSSTVSSEKPADIYAETTPIIEESESDATTPATDLEGTSTSPLDDNECVVNDITYSDGSSVPVMNSCQESCLCSEGTVQCDLRACPPAPPAFFKCTQVESDSCCPSYNCAFPSVNETSGGCEFNGTRFSDGQFIPSGTICKDCYCIDGEVVCATIDCPIPGPNCYAIRQSEYGCCPENYRCDLDTATTEPPATESTAETFEMSTRATDFTEESDDTPTTVAPSVGCLKNDKKYKDGEMVESQNNCEDCFCSNGRVLCSAIECIPPRANCTAVENVDDECCPTKYECEDQPTPSLSIPSTVPDVKYTDKPSDDVLETRDTIQPTDTTEDDTLPDSVTTASPIDVPESTSSISPADETESVTVASEKPIDDESATTIPETETEAPFDTTDEESVTEVEPVTEISLDEDSEVTKAPQEAFSTEAPLVPESTEEPEMISTDASVIPESTDAPTDLETSTDAVPSDTTDAQEAITTTETYLTGCTVNDTEYENGDSIPPNECQDSCVCNNGEVSCKKTACPPTPPAFLRCALESTDGCCPTYKCPNETESTTTGPTCFKEGKEYADGEHVPSEDLCSDCFCIDGRIICATLECEAPGPRCTPAPVPEGICCPEVYDCVEEVSYATATPSPFEERETDAIDEPESTTIPPLSSDASGTCITEGISYEDGETVPVQNSCQESCSCQAGDVLCILRKCPDKPPSFLRCSALRNSTDECCPSYECPQPAETDQPSCEKDGISYMEGEYVNSTNVCTDCHCIDGDIVCATLECELPSARCTPLPPTIEECCPQYLCPGETPTEISPEISTTIPDTEESTTFPEVSKEITTTIPDTVESTSSPETSKEIATTIPDTDESTTSPETSTEVVTTIPDKDESTLSPETLTEIVTTAPDTEESTTSSETSKDTVTTVPDTDKSTVSPELSSEPEIDTESPSDTTESSDAVTELEEATDLATESIPEVTETPTALDQQTEKTASISSMDSVTGSTDIATDSAGDSTKPATKTTDVVSEMATSSPVDLSPITEKPTSTFALEIEDEDGAAGQSTDEISDIPSAEAPSTTAASPLEDKEETTEQPTAETPSEPESSPDPSSSDDPSEGVPIIKSTDTTTGTTQTPSEDAQTTLPPVEFVTETSTDPSTETEKQPDDGDMPESTSVAGITSSSSTSSSETTTAAYEITKTTPDRETTGSTPASEITDEIADTTELSTMSSVDETEDGLSTSDPSVDKELEETTTITPDDNVLPCQMNETIYSDGDSMPALSSCQHNCKCSNGTVKCERQSCPPTPPEYLRCSPVPNYDENQCCPIYSCPPAAGAEDTADASCVKEGKEYLHGEYVPSPTICTDCHCVDGVIVCAEIDCGIPGPNCSPVYQAEDACCPSTYECQEATPTYPAPTVPASEDSGKETTIYIPPELEAVVIDDDDDEKTPSPPVDISDGLTSSLPESSTFREDETYTTLAPIKPSTDSSVTTSLPEETVVDDEEKLVTVLSTPSDLDDLATRITVDQETDDGSEILTTIKPEEVEKDPVTQAPEISSDDTISPEIEKETEKEDKTTPMPSISSTPLYSEEPKVTDIESISTRITEPDADDDDVISTTEGDESGISKISPTADEGEESAKTPTATESTYSDASADVTEAFTVPVEQEIDQKPDVESPGPIVSTEDDLLETQRTEEPIITASEDSIDQTTYPSVTKYEESTEKSTVKIEPTSQKPDDLITQTDEKETVSTRVTGPEIETDSVTSSPVMDVTHGIDSDSLTSSTSAPGTTLLIVDESTAEPILTTVSASSTDTLAEDGVSEKVPDVSSEDAVYSTGISDPTDSTVPSSEDPSPAETEHTEEPKLDESSRLPEGSTIKSTDLETDQYSTEGPSVTESSTSIPPSPTGISESKTPTPEVETSTPSAISEEDSTTPVSPDDETFSTSDEEEVTMTDQPSTDNLLSIETTTEKRTTGIEVLSTSSPKVDVTEGLPASEVTETLIDMITSEPEYKQTEKMPAVGDLSFGTEETPTFAVDDEEDSAITSSVSSAPEYESTIPGKTNDTTVDTITYTEPPSDTEEKETGPTESSPGKLTTVTAIEDEEAKTSTAIPEEEVKITSTELDEATKSPISVTEKMTTLSPFTSTSESSDDVDVTDDVVSTRITSPDTTADEKSPVDESTSPPTDDVTTKQTTAEGITEHKFSSTEASVTTSAPSSDPSDTELPGDATAPSVASESTEGSTEGPSAVLVSQTTTPNDEMIASSPSSQDKPEETLASKSPSETTVSPETTASEISSPSTPATTAHEVQETTARTSPPPLYQTPRPGPPITGYTSAFPPFPGGLFPSSSTTWKPSTTPDFVLGPGACMFDGKVYVSAQQILRDDPCDFCFCFRGDIICLQQSCPPPVPGCFEEPIPGFCCPRYECPLTKAVVNITTTTTPLPTYPPLQRAEEIVMCEIGDRFYHTGEIVEEASGPCLECRCGNDGMMECDPKDCPASPMLGKIFTKGRSARSES